MAVPDHEKGSTGIKTNLADPEQVHTLDPKTDKSGRTTFFAQTSTPGMNGKDIVMKGDPNKKGNKHYYDYLPSNKLSVPLFEDQKTGISTKLAEPE